jgi:hypothetical protein
MPAILAGVANWKTTLQPSAASFVPSLLASSSAVCVVQNLALLSSLVVHRHGTADKLFILIAMLITTRTGTRVLSPKPLNDVFSMLIATPGVSDAVHIHAEVSAVFRYV